MNATSSPGDSSIGMNLAALSLEGSALQIDTLRDVNETAAIVHRAKRGGGKSGVLILGGGSPKNFILQTEPQIQEVLGLAESGHDYFLQITDARPDTGGLSGATPAEAVSWGKIDPEKLPDPLSPEGLMRTSGRGIFLMRAIMDEVHFRELSPGTEITLVKRRNKSKEMGR